MTKRLKTAVSILRSDADLPAGDNDRDAIAWSLENASGLIEAQEQLLASYRLRRTPSDNTLDQITMLKKRLEM